MAQSTKKKKFTLTSVKFAPVRGEKCGLGRELEKRESGLCLALLTVVEKIVLICLWTGEVKALLPGINNAYWGLISMLITYIALGGKNTKPQAKLTT